MWIQDFCTKCDKQCVFGNVYCSDSCRLEDEQAQQQLSLSPQNFSSPSPAASIDLASEASPFSLKKGSGFGSKTNSAAAAAAGSFSRTKGMSSFSSNTQAAGAGPGPAAAAAFSAPQQASSGYLSSSAAQEFRFMYQSPMLRPANATASSPPVSPLLTAEADQDQIPNLSSSAYVSWLRR